MVKNNLVQDCWVQAYKHPKNQIDINQQCCVKGYREYDNFVDLKVVNHPMLYVGQYY
jgi:hypothetical protein